MTSAARALLVVNPRSGGGRTGKTFAAMREAITHALGEVDVATTDAQGHAIAITREAVDAGRELVIAVGGDGTMHEVINGAMNAREDARKRTRIGVIGQGTGGDFRRTLGLEHRLNRYLEAIASGRSRTIDLARIRYRDVDANPAERYFVNIASCGMGGLVDRYVAEASRRFGGTLTYYGASLRALATIIPGHLKCTVTDEEGTRDVALRSLMLAVCNGRYFGSGMHVAPMAALDDGRLEVVSLDAPSKFAFAIASQAIYAGAHMKNASTVHFSCTKIAIDLANDDAREVFLLDVDGEPLGRLPIEIEVVPKAITLAA